MKRIFQRIIDFFSFKCPYWEKCPFYSKGGTCDQGDYNDYCGRYYEYEKNNLYSGSFFYDLFNFAGSLQRRGKSS